MVQIRTTSAWHPVLQVNPLNGEREREREGEGGYPSRGLRERDGAACVFLRRTRPGSQSIVGPENVNGTSLKGTPLPDESDYRITGVEVLGHPQRMLECAECRRTATCKILTGVNDGSSDGERAHKERERPRAHASSSLLCPGRHDYS